MSGETRRAAVLLTMTALSRLRAPLLALCFASMCSVALAQDVDDPRFDVREFEIGGEIPISKERAQAVLAPYARSGITLTDLRGAARALETELSQRGFPFYRVVLPAQAIESVVKLRVLAFRLANESPGRYSE